LEIIVGILQEPLVIAQLDLESRLFFLERFRRENRLLLVEFIPELLELLFLLADFDLLLLEYFLEIGKSDRKSVV
jgi:hypothetical protein